MCRDKHFHCVKLLRFGDILLPQQLPAHLDKIPYIQEVRWLGSEPHFSNRRLLPITLEAEAGKVSADSIHSKTHIRPSTFPPTHFNISEIRFCLVINSLSQSLLAWCQCDKVVIAWNLLARFKKIPASKLEECVSPWKEISGTMVEQS